MRLGLELVRRRCKRPLASLTLTAVLAWTSPALSQASSSDEMARRHFESGVAYLEESDYESALKAFEKAYELSKRPAILLNIATVHERRGDVRAAVDSLNKYLELEPAGEHSETAKLRVQNLEKRLAQQDQPAETEPAPAKGSETDQAQAPAPPAPQPPASPPPQPEPPSRLPAYIALGVGGLAAGGAVVTGILASNKHSDLKESCSPNCSDDDIAGAKTMAWVSTGLTVGAGVGLGVGVVLLLVNAPNEEPQVASAKPRIAFGLGKERADARATWRF